MDYLIKRSKLKNILSKVVLILSVFLFACKSHYNSISTPISLKDDVVDRNSVIEFKKPVKINFNSNVHYNKRYNLKGQIIYYTNEQFQIKIYSRTMGIEIARLQVFNDSMLFIDRINKTVYNYPKNNSLKFKGFNINIDNVIKAMFGKSFDNINYVSSDENSYNYEFLNYKGRAEFNTEGYYKVNSFKNDEREIILNYSNYSIKYNLPFNTLINYNFKDHNYTAEINITSVDKIKSNNFKAFKINSSYKIGND